MDTGTSVHEEVNTAGIVNDNGTADDAGLTEKQKKMLEIEARIEEMKQKKDVTSLFDEKDINNNTLMAILSYLSVLVLIPIFFARKSKYARFHANQGLVLTIAVTIYSIIGSVVNEIVSADSVKSGLFVTTIFQMCGIAFFVLTVIGIVNAVRGKAKQLPTFGGITILKVK